MTTMVSHPISSSAALKAQGQHNVAGGHKESATPKRPFEVHQDDSAGAGPIAASSSEQTQEAPLGAPLQQALLSSGSEMEGLRDLLNPTDSQQTIDDQYAANLLQAPNSNTAAHEPILQVLRHDPLAKMRSTLAGAQAALQASPPAGPTAEQNAISTPHNIATTIGQEQVVSGALPAQATAAAASVPAGAANLQVSQQRPAMTTREAIMPVSRASATSETRQPESQLLNPEGVTLKEAAASAGDRPQNPNSALNLAANPEFAISRDSRGEGSRIEGVRILNEQITDVDVQDPGGSAKKQQVKSIDLQLQPNNLGRVTVKMTSTSDGMLVQIAPQLQQTASLLSDNQLALQRVLSSIGAGAELATVRIIEPQTELKDGVNADLESGEGSGETEFEGNSERFFQGQTTEQGHAAEGILRDGDGSDSSPVPQTSEQSSDAIYL